MDLRREARAFATIGNALNSAASLMFKGIIAPTAIMATLGVKKYLQTTEIGARQLGMSLMFLYRAWDQMLARIGKAIASHGELRAVVDKLKKFIDSIDDRKIMQMLSVAKWSAILFIMIKMVATIDMMTVAAKRLQAAFMIISGSKGFKSYAKAAEYPNKGGSGSQNFTNIGYGSFLGIIISNFGKFIKEFKSVINMMTAGGRSFSTLSDAWKNLSIALNYAGYKVTGVFYGFTKLGNVLGKVFGWLSVIGILFQAYNIGKDAENQISILNILGDTISTITNLFMILVTALEGLVSTVAELVSGLGHGIISAFKFAIGKETLPQVGERFDKLGNAWENYWNDWTEKINAYRDALPWNKGNSKSKKQDYMSFMGTGVRTVGFEDLNKQVQGSVFTNLLSESKQQTGYLRNISNKLNTPIGRGGSGSSTGDKATTAGVFRSDYDLKYI